MKFSKARTLRFNMGPYEHVEVSAAVEADPDELDDTADPVEQLDALLDDLLYTDVARAAKTTNNDESFVHEYKRSSR